MIDPKELRIGNWVIIHGDRMFPIEEICKRFIRVTYIRRDTGKPHTSAIAYSDLEPVSFTPEILEKCGFKNTVGRFWRKDPFEVQILTMNAVVYYRPKGLDTLIGFYKHIHQLQNLYFDLTGEELEIKELSNQNI